MANTPARRDRRAEPRNGVLLTVADAAARMGVGKMDIYRMVWAGELSWVNIGTPGRRARIRIRDTVIDAYIDARETPGRVA